MKRRFVRAALAFACTVLLAVVPARAAPESGPESGPGNAPGNAPGASLYAANCAVCHKANAAGAAGQYPPLAGRIDKIAASASGRQYLADVLVHGMVGHIEAAGASYVGYMPAFRQLSDADTAAILTWLSTLRDSKPSPVIHAAEIHASRDRKLSASAVARERSALSAQHPLP